MNTKKVLEGIKDTSDSGIKIAVIDIILKSSNDYEDLSTYMNEITEHGCASGIISEFTYYRDTNKFYDEHHGEIDDMIEDYKNDLGCDTWIEAVSKLGGAKHICDMNTLKNLLTWFAVEVTVCELIDKVNDSDDYDEDEED